MRWGDIKIKRLSTVIDCGAHIGSFTKLACSHQAKVFAIEADDENFELLEKNTAGCKNLKLLKAILWNGKEVAFLKDKERGELNKIDATGVLQPSISLDQIVRDFKITKIDLLKMDIEGAEYEVLYNFKHLNLVQQLTMEWHYGSSNMAKLIIFLEKNGLKVVWSAGNGEWGKIQAKRSEK
jgi:FkbM family methyltransferase